MKDHLLFKPTPTKLNTNCSLFHFHESNRTAKNQTHDKQVAYNKKRFRWVILIGLKSSALFNNKNGWKFSFWKDNYFLLEKQIFREQKMCFFMFSHLLIKRTDEYVHNNQSYMYVQRRSMWYMRFGRGTEQRRDDM